MHLFQLVCMIVSVAAHSSCADGASCSYVNWHGHTVYTHCYSGVCGGYHDDNIVVGLLFFLLFVPLLVYMCDRCVSNTI